MNNPNQDCIGNKRYVLNWHILMQTVIIRYYASNLSINIIFFVSKAILIGIILIKFLNFKFIYFKNQSTKYQQTIYFWNQNEEILCFRYLNTGCIIKKTQVIIFFQLCDDNIFVLISLKDNKRQTLQLLYLKVLPNIISLASRWAGATYWRPHNANWK